ncbi:MAG: branched-chain amino acid transporter [Candidatus Carbobacillus altaicus]|uniref:Branched-chain amino acid transporter n=1 Tax=Candidatus Carbonibacillus altaicus TaxID=2163959 RepID=A0A2R6XXQ7_9BACL|nr:MAG: branched-chain amino acid transporter [Candidatus Carbobacillus altaicus]
MFVFAGASQFIAVSMAALGSSWGSIVLLVFMLNLRHLLMSMHIASRFVDHRRWIRALVAFGVTDETYAMLMMRSRDLSPPMVLSLQFTAYISWVAGTWVGYTLGDALPERLQSGLGIALYAMFIALLVPSIRGKRSALMVSLLAMLSNTLFSRWIPSGLAIILTAVLIPLLMTWLLPSEMTTSRENDQVENLEIEQP